MIGFIHTNAFYPSISLNIFPGDHPISVMADILLPMALF